MNIQSPEITINCLAPPAHVKSQHTIRNNGSYVLWNYDRDTLGDEDSAGGAFRSVITSFNTGHVLCFSPPKSASVDAMLPGPVQSPEHFVVSTTVEGTMVNLFWNPEIQSWEIATRAGIGGNYWYFRTKYGGDTSPQMTFRQMFIEALRGDPANLDLNCIPQLHLLPKDQCYSFVLQHPENHLVFEMYSSHAILVDVYRLINVDDAGAPCKLSVSPSTNVLEWETTPPRVKLCSGDRLPSNEVPSNEVPSSGATEVARVAKILLTERIVREAAGTHLAPGKTMGDFLRNLETGNIDSDLNIRSMSMGVMLVDIRTGVRLSLENPHYTALRELRGNHPNLQYQYLHLASVGRETEFLAKFPKYQWLFAQFRAQYDGLVADIHRAYVLYYAQRVRNCIIPPHIIPHILYLHTNVYIPSVVQSGVSGQKQDKRKITLKVVREYVDAMSIGKQFAVLSRGV